MSPESFIFMAMLFFIPGMYSFSIFWYLFISKKRGIYIIEILAAIGALVGMITLVAMANEMHFMGYAIASLFVAFFLISVIGGALVSALLVKLTIVLVKKDK